MARSTELAIYRPADEIAREIAMTAYGIRYSARTDIAADIAGAITAARNEALELAEAAEQRVAELEAERTAALTIFEQARNERDTLRRLLTETAVPALEDVARWVGGMCSCRADNEYHNGLLEALSTIRAQMGGGNG